MVGRGVQGEVCRVHLQMHRGGAKSGGAFTLRFNAPYATDQRQFSPASHLRGR